MILFYNIFIFLFNLVISIISPFNQKARLWRDGRKGVYKKIDDILSNIDLNKNYKKRYWIHVASLGEFEQGRPIIEALKNENTNTLIILTFFSPSGYEIRKNYPLADAIFYLPLDTARNAKLFLDLIKPDIAIFVKYEFWFHYLNQLKKRQIRTLLISGIFREKQFNTWSPYAYFLRKILPFFSHFFVQNTPSVFLLQKQGFDNVTLAGDTRIDRVVNIPKEGRTFPLIESFVKNKNVLICGSTWEADESVIIPLLEDKAFENWVFIFAPHDISPTNVARLKKSLTTPSVFYSHLEGTLNESLNSSKILIINNIGMLSALYRYGKIAYIGGGFGKGIHNILEPIAFDIPVVFGTNYSKFEEANQLLEKGGAFSISESKQLKTQLLNLNEIENYNKASAAVKRYIEENKGATDLIMQYIKSI